MAAEEEVKEEVADAPSEAPKTTEKDIEALRVPKPDDDALKAAIEAVTQKIEKKKEKLGAIKEQIESRGDSNRGEPNSELAIAKSKHNDTRAESRRLQQEKRNIYDQISAADELKKQQTDLTQRLRSELTLFSVEEVDRRIKALEHQQQTTTTTVKEDKKILDEIKKLSGNKPMIKQYDEAQSSMRELKEHHNNLYSQLKAKNTELAAVKEEEEKLKQAVDKAREKEDAKKSDIPALYKERENLRKEINDLRDEMKKIREDNNEKRKKWYEYQKAVSEQKKKEYLERKAQRQAEWEALQKLREEEEAKRDPWEEEKEICETLISWCGKYLPKEATEEKPQAGGYEVPKGMIMGGKKKLDDDEDYFGGVGKKKGKRKGGSGPAGAPPAPKSTKIVLSPSDFAIFEKLGFKPPSMTGDVPALRAQLLEKREWLKTAPPKPKKKPAEKAKEEPAEMEKEEAFDLEAFDKEEKEKKRAEETKKQAERDAIDAANAAKAAEIEAQGKRAAGGLHKFDPDEVDINGGTATADDFMDAFGLGDDADDSTSADVEVVYKDVLGAFVDAAISEMSETKPDDPYRKMYEFLFQASLVDYTASPAEADKSKWDSDFVAKFGLVFHGDAVIASKGKGKGPKNGVKFMLADAGDIFSELSKKMKATGAPLTGMMTAEELRAADAAAAKMKREKLAKEQAARDEADAENAKRSAEMEASGKKVSGGLHKFDAAEVDINGGSATADDFMDAFGF